MSEQFIDTTSDEYVNAPKALRDAYDALKTRVTETEKERDTLRARATDAALGDVLKEFKNPSKVKTDLTRDGVDPLDSEAVTKWLETNGDDYAKGDGSAPSTPAARHPDAAAHQQIARVDLSQPADMSKIEAALSELGPDATPEQVIAVYQKHGV